MILLIDNYDSFSYNLYQLIGSLRPDVQVVRNDALTLEEIDHLAQTGALEAALLPMLQLYIRLSRQA